MSAFGPTELSDLLASETPPVLIHVLPLESWESSRLPGSQCACVYEMTFLEAVQGLSSDSAAPLVVYGAGLPSLDSTVATEKLTAAGYTNIINFAGGLTAWEAAGLPVEGSGNPPALPAFDGNWKADCDTSMVHWTGRNLFNHHEGTVQLSDGAVAITGGAVTAARFVIDLRSIACTDLTDPGPNGMLLSHLADRDFFETAVHPEAVFTATAASPFRTPPRAFPIMKSRGP